MYRSLVIHCWPNGFRSLFSFREPEISIPFSYHWKTFALCWSWTVAGCDTFSWDWTCVAVRTLVLRPFFCFYWRRQFNWIHQSEKHSNSVILSLFSLDFPDPLVLVVTLYSATPTQRRNLISLGKLSPVYCSFLWLLCQRNYLSSQFNIISFLHNILWV